MQHLNILESSFLAATAELVRRQQEVAPLLAEYMGVPPSGLLYAWMDRSFPAIQELDEDDLRVQVDDIPDTEWEYFFHGLECDLHHRDGRHVRIEFGPRGRLDVTSGYAVLQFVMTSKAPWPEYPVLRNHLADKPPPYNSLSGSHRRMCDLWERLETLGFFEEADPALCALVEKCTTVLPSGSRRIDLPEEMDLHTRLDSMICQRKVLTPVAYRALAKVVRPSTEEPAT